ncbi:MULTISPECIES: HalOD1 output domain-containing protein [Salinibaculum]|uniref:HalOD1 output domain-containing protein n=1 Tax=Salinibaculum TaxID=2732368 RepID=UPI0030D25C71
MSQPPDSPNRDAAFVYDQGPDERASAAVVAAVAEATGESPLEMARLGTVVDTDALNILFDSTSDDPSPTTFTFEYCDVDVTVTPSEVLVDS